MFLFFQNYDELCFSSFIESVYKFSINMFNNNTKEIVSIYLEFVVMRIYIASIKGFKIFSRFMLVLVFQCVQFGVNWRIK